MTAAGPERLHSRGIVLVVRRRGAQCQLRLRRLHHGKLLAGMEPPGELGDGQRVELRSRDAELLGKSLAEGKDGVRNGDRGLRHRVLWKRGQ